MEWKKRVRGDDDSDESALESSKEKRPRESLLEFLDDADSVPPSQDLDSVMKSLQEEIAAPFVDLTSDSGESPRQIWLPPMTEKNEEPELACVDSDSFGIGELWSFENRISSYDSFEFGTEEYYLTNNNRNNYYDYVAFDGIFDNSDVYYDDSAWLSESWWYEDLPEL